MRKVFAVAASIALAMSFAVPAQSAGAKYTVYQKTLSAFSSTATDLTSQQKAQVKAAVEAKPSAEKFIYRYSVLLATYEHQNHGQKACKGSLRVCKAAKPRAFYLVPKQAN